MTSILLVHGAWHGAWCWDRVVERLRADGVEVQAIDLPSDHVDGAGFTDDVAAVRDALDGMRDVVLCGHSYGGAVISEAGAHDNVAHLVYLCAYALDVGETVMANAVDSDPVAAAAVSDLASAIRVDGNLVTLDLDQARAAFYADCDVEPVDRLVPHNLAAFTTATAAAAWKDKPSTYVLCTQDRAIHPDVQRFLAGRCTRTIELDASHSPFLSMPDRVAAILRTAVA
jgi:pimeloyl-ACP methyl ester carboxylesterase